MQNLCRQIEHDPLLFDDGLFVIEPKEGVVWPNSEVKVNVIFRPQAAAKYVETLYCEITGRETRLPLQILVGFGWCWCILILYLCILFWNHSSNQGEAFGPHVQFSFEILDAGENFINSPKDFEVGSLVLRIGHAFPQHSSPTLAVQVTLENTGDIDARYALIPLNTAFSSKFAFTPSSGLLKVGEQQKITIHFESDILGDFCEEFVWELEVWPRLDGVLRTSAHRSP